MGESVNVCFFATKQNGKSDHLHTPAHSHGSLVYILQNPATKSPTTCDLQMPVSRNETLHPLSLAADLMSSPL